MHMSRTRNVWTWALGFVSAAAFVAGAAVPQALQARAASASADAPQGRGGGGGQGGGQGRGGATAPRPYNEVITAAAKSDDGVFKVHRITEGNNDTLLYEIPKKELDKDFLWN